MRASTTFRIPVAIDSRGRLVPPEEAERSARYRCPSCETGVDLHAGEKKQRHFHHRAATCSTETVLHLAAKRWIVQAVEAWQAGGPAVTFLRRCAAEGCAETTLQTIPKKVLRAAEETRLRTGHVVDVALVGVAELVIAAIEVLVSHEVDDEKATELGVPWIEVAAEDVCSSRGLVLTPVRDRFLPWLCEAHNPTRKEAAKTERDAQRVRASVLRALPYRLDEFPGYRVADVVRCPNGHDTVTLAWDGREPPWPRPPNVIAHAKDEDVIYDAPSKGLRRVLPFRRGWACACHRCGARLV